MSIERYSSEYDNYLRGIKYKFNTFYDYCSIETLINSFSPNELEVMDLAVYANEQYSEVELIQAMLSMFIEELDYKIEELNSIQKHFNMIYDAIENTDLV